MATVRDIIERAARKIGILAANRPMQADMSDHALATFNDMMNSYAARGANTLHVNQGLNDTIALPPKLHEALVYLLAARLAPDYTVAAPSDDRHERTLQAHFLNIRTSEMPGPLLRPPSRSWRRW